MQVQSALTPLKMAELTWFEYQRRLEEDAPILMLPTGSIEQHGPHLPLITDTLIAEMISERVAALIGAIVASPFAYGYKSQPKSGGGNHFCGTTSLDGATYSAMLRDVICEFARHGVRKLVIVDGHCENGMFLVEGIDLALRQLRYAGIEDLKVVKLGYWEFINQQTEDVLFPDGLSNWDLEHAAMMETSVMLHLRPDLVRKELIPNHAPANFPPYDVFPIDTRPIPPDGVLSSIVDASAEKGAIVVEQVVSAIASALTNEFAS